MIEENVGKTISFFTVGIWGKYHMYKKINEYGLKWLEIIEKSRVNFMFSSQWDIAVYWREERREL